MMSLNRKLVIILSISLASLSFSNAQAAWVSNDQILYSTQQINEKENLLQTIAQADLQHQLSSMGVSPTDLENRIQQMTPAEIAQLNQQIAELPAGAGVVGVALLIFIIFVITDVLGATDLFTFIHPVRF